MKPDLPIDTQILWLAAELVEREGHCKGLFSKSYNWVTTRCALIAIVDASKILGNEDGRTRAIDRLQEYIPSHNVIAWNDHPSRTAAEVALALRTA